MNELFEEKRYNWLVYLLCMEEQAGWGKNALVHVNFADGQVIREGCVHSLAKVFAFLRVCQFLANYNHKIVLYQHCMVYQDKNVNDSKVQ